MKNLSQYCKELPSPQNLIDLCSQWISLLPDLPNNPLQSGKVPLFQDSRIQWAAEYFGGFQGMKILELGPLEGGHSYMLEHLGADYILAIESNKEAFLKCLIVKELYGLYKCHFILGDFMKHLRQTTETYDFCLASGVLYHMLNPVELLSLIARVADKTLIWTHYYDEKIISRMSFIKRRRYSKGEVAEFAGFACPRHKQVYGLNMGRKFLGGTARYSYWLKSDDIISALKYFGFKKVEVNFNQLDHPNGPCFCLACSKG
jgi:hypothetical protein